MQHTTDIALCEECNHEGTLRCTSCKDSRYCSEECQKKGWPIHKLLCKSFKQFEAPCSLPSNATGVVRAIYFSPSRDKPQFVWLSYTSIYPGYLRVHLGGSLAVTPREADTGEYLSSGWCDIVTSVQLGRDLPFTIRLHHRDGFVTADADENKAIRKVSSPLSPYTHKWRGPVIAYGIDKFTVDSHPKRAINLSTVDLPHIAKFLDTYLYQKPSDALQRAMENLNLGTIVATAVKQPLEMVPCVRVNCDGDVEIDGRPKFETINLPASHGIFHQAPTPVSARIKLPVAAARIPGSVETWETKRRRGSYWPNPNVNQAITFLYLGCDPLGNDDDFMKGGYAWGLAPLTWDIPLGSCIVARKDKKPMFPEHAAALSEFCQFHLISFFEEQREGGKSRDHVLTEITKAKFEEYFVKWKGRQEDEMKRARISPYGV